MRTVILMLNLVIWHYGKGQFSDIKWVYSVSACITDFSGATPFSYNTVTTDVTAYANSASINYDLDHHQFFFSNGFTLGDTGAHQIMNADRMIDSILDATFSSPPYQSQNTLILPMIGSVYYVFHTSTSDTSMQAMNQRPDRFYYAVVDLSGNNGLGDVIGKKIPLIQEQMSWSRTTACRHANGRDWWLIRCGTEGRYYKFLVTPSEVISYAYQDLGDTCHFDTWGQAAFSANGTKFATITAQCRLNVFDFDRCTGIFSHPTYFQVPLDSIILNGTTYYEEGGGLGVCFSPNSRFIYTTTKYFIWQFDLNDNSIIKVGTYSQYAPPPFSQVPRYFENMELAPPPYNYILISNYIGGISAFHIIISPDEKGVLCNEQNWGFPVPYSATGLPNMPNYRLGALAGSPCDTLGLGVKTETTTAQQMIIYPNPANTFIAVNVPDYLTAGILIITDALGRKMGEGKFTGIENRFQISSFAQGIYTVEVKQGSRIYNGKFVKE